MDSDTLNKNLDLAELDLAAKTVFFCAARVELNGNMTDYDRFNHQAETSRAYALFDAARAEIADIDSARVESVTSELLTRLNVLGRVRSEALRTGRKWLAYGDAHIVEIVAAMLGWTFERVSDTAYRVSDAVGAHLADFTVTGYDYDPSYVTGVAADIPTDGDLRLVAQETIYQLVGWMFDNGTVVDTH